MDFFEHQDRSRRKSRRLVAMFLVAVVAIVAAVDLVVIFLLGGARSPDGTAWGWLQANAGMLSVVSLLTAVGILGASTVRIAQLRAGGGVVARGLGAVEVPDNPGELPLKRLRNVVEETALASGLPVPELFVLEQESGINAFAAGHEPADAAIAVTRGALDRLSRNELQGVIAHEFSHVANGDMRLSLRLMGWAFGILAIAMAGRAILRGLARGGGRRQGAGVAVFGLALMVVGYVGVFAARVIKAAVSRERERLADASAVQFTREPTGLAGALKKIGGLGVGSELSSADAEEVSHMLFAPGFTARLLATHPPLVGRIRALEPGFDPAQLGRPPRTQAPEPEPEAGQDAAMPMAAAGLIPAALLAGGGQPDDAQLKFAGELRRAIPEALYRAAHERDGARALVGGSLISPEAGVRARQQPVLVEWLGTPGAEQAKRHGAALRELQAPVRLALVDLAWPRVRRLPPEELADMQRAVQALVRADGRIRPFEYALARRLRVLIRDLVDDRDRPALKLDRCRTELADLFAVLASEGHGNETAARRAYEAGLSKLLGRDRPDFRVPPDWPAALDRALDRLDALPAVIKRELIEALGATVAHDGRLDVAEAALLRAVAASLHCPLPMPSPGAAH